MTRKPVSNLGITADGVVSFVIILLAVFIFGAVVHYGEKLPAPEVAEVATPPYPWIVLNGGDGGTEEFNSWKIRVFYFVEQSHILHPVFTDSLFKALGLTYQMTDSTFIGTPPVIQQNVPIPNAP